MHVGSLLSASLVLSFGCAAAPALSAPLNLRHALYDPSASGPIHDAHAYQRLAEREQESGPHDRAATIDVEHYDLVLAVEPTLGTLAGQATIHYKSLVRALATVELDAVDLQIERVEGLKGAPLAFDYDGKLLLVHLPALVAGGERSLLTVYYKALMSQSLFLAGPEPTNKTQMTAAYTYTEPEGTRDWFPCVDRPSDKATISLTVTVPDGMKALSNGDLMDARPGPAGETFEYRMDKQIATYLVSLAIGPYVQVELGAFKSKPVRIWTPPALAAKAKVTTVHTVDMMNAYAAFTGVDYPWSSYTLSVAEAYGTSMEHQSATTMGGTRITGDESGEGVVAHELGHQWFGDLVTCRNWGELWLNEGFASYLPYVYFSGRADAGPRAVAQPDWWRDGYFAQAATKVHALSSPDPDFADLFDSHAYEKGALVIHLMRNVADAMPSADGGTEEVFTKALRLYLTRNGQSTATSFELQRALEEATGQSWQLFFDQWVRSPGHPELKVAAKWDGGALVVDVEQAQATRAERRWRTFTFPLEIEILAADGASHLETVEVYDEHQTFTFPQAAAPAAINVNPRWIVPATVAFVQSPAAWTSVLATSPYIESRVQALRNLYEASEKTLAADAMALVRADKSRYVQIAALDLLSQRNEDREKVAQIYHDLAGALLFDEDVSVRQAVATTEAWLVTTLGTAPTRDQETQWQRRYLQTGLVTERTALLDMLFTASPERAQEFVLQRTAEPEWVTADRRSFTKMMSTALSPISLPFVKDSLETATYIYARQTLSVLIDAKVDAPGLVPALLSGAKTNRYYDVRARMVALLGKQLTSKTTVCPELTQLAAVAPTDPRSGYMDQVHVAATLAQQELGCNAH